MASPHHACVLTVPAELCSPFTLFSYLLTYLSPLPSFFSYFLHHPKAWAVGQLGRAGHRSEGENDCAIFPERLLRKCGRNILWASGRTDGRSSHTEEKKEGGSVESVLSNALVFLRSLY